MILHDIRKQIPAIVCLALLLTGIPLNAATIYDELVDGDLVDGIKVSPWVSPGDVVGVLLPGSNVVVGDFGKHVGDLSEDTDTLTFEIAVGTQLDSIQMTYTVLSGNPGGGSYFAIQAGPSLGSGISSVAGNLSNKLVATSGDLLASFAAGPDFGGIGLSSPLAAGQYTLWMSETATDTNIGYSLDFQVTSIPEPATGILGLFAALGFVGKRRRLL